MSHTALLTVDVQNDFLPPDGSMAVEQGRDVIPIIQHLLDPSKYHWDHLIASQVGHHFPCYGTTLNPSRTIIQKDISHSHPHMGRNPIPKQR